MAWVGNTIQELSRNYPGTIQDLKTGLAAGPVGLGWAGWARLGWLGLAGLAELGWSELGLAGRCLAGLAGGANSE